jgi:hypothetical protein
MAPSTPEADTGTGHSPAGSAMGVTLLIWSAMAMSETMLPWAWRCAKASIAESPRPTWSVVSTRAVPRRAIEAQLRRGRLSADSDILTERSNGISLNGDEISQADGDIRRPFMFLYRR